MSSQERPLADNPLLDVTLVMPFFNPGGDALGDTVVRAAETLASSKISFEIVAVSDGSTDGSARSIDGILPEVLVTIVLPRNRGKGYALREGMSRGRGSYIGFIDADGDIAPEVLSEFVRAFTVQPDGSKPDIVYGSKRHPGLLVHYSVVRKVYSWVYQRLVNVLFDLSAADTQTGVKFVRRDVLSTLLPYMTEDRFAFDLELFVLARQAGFENFIEVPVRIEKRVSSTVSIRSVWSISRDTLGIFWRCRIRGGTSELRDSAIRARTAR